MQLITAAVLAGQPAEDAMLAGIVEVRHPYCAAAELHIGDQPLESQLAGIIAGQDRAAPLLLEAFPELPLAQMIFDHRSRRWY